MPQPDFIQTLTKSTIGTIVHNYAYIRATAEEDLAIQLSRFYDEHPAEGSSKGGAALEPSQTTYGQHELFVTMKTRLSRDVQRSSSESTTQATKRSSATV